MEIRQKLLYIGGVGNLKESNENLMETEPLSIHIGVYAFTDKIFQKTFDLCLSKVLNLS